MTPPKEPRTFNYPRMYYQPGTDESTLAVAGSRVRIIYPDGRAEWCLLSSMKPSHEWADGRCDSYNEAYTFEEPCCYLAGGGSAYGMVTLRIMREYDERRGFPPAEFLGEIK
jgi:hypothetical protein